MNRRLATLALPTLLSGAAVVAAALGAFASPPPPPARFPLGDTLSNVTLTTLDGERAPLRERLGARAALIYVFGPEHCASCSNLPMEFQILKKVAPDLRTLLIASGAPADSFAEHIDQMGIRDRTLVDEHRLFLKSLGLTKEPLVLLADSTGRIVLVDARSVPRAAQYPMGRILRDLSLVLRPQAPATPKR